jgi:kynureninase
MASIELLHEAGIERLRAKSVALTRLAIDLADRLPQSAGFEVATPRQPERRGSHIALRHGDAAAVCAALQERGVITDFRPPDIIRLGFAPLYTRFVDVWDAFDQIASL